MIVHCSLWKFREGTSPEQIREIANEWRALKDVIPEIRRIEVGPDLGHWPENHDLAALIYFDGPEGYAAYRGNADHLAFANAYLLPYADGLHMRAAAQFELGTPSF